DGFPRTLPQARALDELLERKGASLNAALCIDLPRELLMERATLRRTDVRTGQIYHLKYNPPPDSAELAQYLVHRDDDKEETVRKRLDAYDNMTAPLLPYYQAKNLLCHVDGVGSPDEVSARIDRVVRQLNGASYSIEAGTGSASSSDTSGKDASTEGGADGG